MEKYLPTEQTKDSACRFRIFLAPYIQSEAAESPVYWLPPKVHICGDQSLVYGLDLSLVFCRCCSGDVLQDIGCAKASWRRWSTITASTKAQACCKQSQPQALASAFQEDLVGMSSPFCRPWKTSWNFVQRFEVRKTDFSTRIYSRLLVLVWSVFDQLWRIWIYSYI